MPDAALRDLLDRLAVRCGEVVYLSAEDLTVWPEIFVAAIKSQGIIKPSSPAQSAICGGCERECVMPVHLVSSAEAQTNAFVVCDKRSDINRVRVPMQHLERWQISGDLVADVLAELLGTRRPLSDESSERRWDLGVLKGAKHSSHVVLNAGKTLVLSAAGHSVELVDVISLKGGKFVVDKQSLTKRIDKPVAKAGDEESAEKRRFRLQRRVRDEKKKGNRAFIKTVAAEEQISAVRLRQILGK